MIRENNWNDCLDFGNSRAISLDLAKSKSLVKIALARIDFTENNSITKENCNFIFEDYYSSVTEIIHSLALSKGYKITNHICLGYFTKEILKDNNLFVLFEDCRVKRNSLVYYGSEMEFETAKTAVEKCKKLISEFLKLT